MATDAPVVTASPKVLAPATHALDLSPKSVHRGLTPRASSQSLTGAAALADARRALREANNRQTSPHPAAVALGALMGAREMSTPSDAPSTSQLSEPLRHVADKVTVAVTNGHSSPKAGTNGNASQSASTGGNGASMTATAPADHDSSQFVEEPESMEDMGNDDNTHQDDETRPFTYPGPSSHAQQHDDGSRRDMSYDSGSKSTKRHKCPYCNTDFTRHHNLKSHLLTHSQEKPYVCQTCQARFRRLHDLKRHTKLHTGERPHTCSQCGRKFARGDALARHNKGPGGCANRKSSFGAGDDDEDMGDETMDGLEYDHDQEDRGEESEVMDGQARRVSEPNRKRPHPDSSPHDPRGPYREYSSTYPPPPMASLKRDAAPMAPPPTVLSPGAKTVDHHSNLASYYSQPTGSSYPPPVVTESPRPLSPRGPDQHRLSVGDPSGLRNRSPSLTSNYQSPQYGRVSIPTMAPGGRSHQLPSLPGIAAVQPPQPVQPPSYASNHGSHSSHGHSSASSLRDVLGPDPNELVAYLRSQLANLDQRFSRMQDEYEMRMNRLSTEILDLKKYVHDRR